MKARSLARTDEGVAFFNLIEKYVRFPSISAFAEMTEVQFGFLMESMRYRTEKQKIDQDATESESESDKEIRDALQRLDALEGKI